MQNLAIDRLIKRSISPVEFNLFFEINQMKVNGSFQSNRIHTNNMLHAYTIPQ